MRSPSDHPLRGRRVALPESRELDLFSDMLEKRGASVLRCPLVAIRDAPDCEAVEAWLGELIRGEMSHVILYTGEGLRRLMGFAERAELSEAVIAALGRVRKVARGPKPTKALREIGLRPEVTVTGASAGATTEGIMQALADEPLGDAVVGVQLYGAERNERLMHFLREHGAEPRPVWPYVYASQVEDERVVGLIEALGSGTVDLIAFTGSPQVRRLWTVARATKRERQLERALAGTKVAAVGPVVAAALEEAGVRVDVMPQRRHSLRPLTDAIIAVL